MPSGAQADARQPAPTSMMETLERVTALIGATEKGIAKVTAPYGLSTIEFECLWFCLNRERETTATELASHLPVDAPRVSRIVTTLVDKGLLSRRRLRTDRRVVMLRLSDDGKDLALQARQTVELFIAKLTEGVSKRELQGLASAASKIVANYDALNQPK